MVFTTIYLSAQGGKNRDPIQKFHSCLSKMAVVSYYSSTLVSLCKDPWLISCPLRGLVDKGPLCNMLLSQCLQMSMQEYELMQEEKEDESCLQKYRKRCMQDMHQRLSFGPKYGYLCELQNGEEFLEVIEKERKTTTVIVHIYEDDIKGCEALNNSLSCLATEYASVRFCSIRASNTGAGDRFSSDVLPTLLVYKGGELLSNFISVTEHFSEDFFAVDVESFLNEYGLLPERELPALKNGNMDEQDIE